MSSGWVGRPRAVPSSRGVRDGRVGPGETYLSSRRPLLAGWSYVPPAPRPARPLPSVTLGRVPMRLTLLRWREWVRRNARSPTKSAHGAFVRWRLLRRWKRALHALSQREELRAMVAARCRRTMLHRAFHHWIDRGSARLELVKCVKGHCLVALLWTRRSSLARCLGLWRAHVDDLHRVLALSARLPRSSGGSRILKAHVTLQASKMRRHIERWSSFIRPRQLEQALRSKVFVDGETGGSRLRWLVGGLHKMLRLHELFDVWHRAVCMKRADCVLHARAARLDHQSIGPQRQMAYAMNRLRRWAEAALSERWGARRLRLLRGFLVLQRASKVCALITDDGSSHKSGAVIGAIAGRERVDASSIGVQGSPSLPLATCKTSETMHDQLLQLSGACSASSSVMEGHACEGSATNMPHGFSLCPSTPVAPSAETIANTSDARHDGGALHTLRRLYLRWHGGASTRLCRRSAARLSRQHARSLALRCVLRRLRQVRVRKGAAALEGLRANQLRLMARAIGWSIARQLKHGMTRWKLRAPPFLYPWQGGSWWKKWATKTKRNRETMRLNDIAGAGYLRMTWARIRLAAMHQSQLNIRRTRLCKLAAYAFLRSQLVRLRAGTANLSREAGDRAILLHKAFAFRGIGPGGVHRDTRRRSRSGGGNVLQQDMDIAALWRARETASLVIARYRMRRSFLIWCNSWWWQRRRLHAIAELVVDRRRRAIYKMRAALAAAARRGRVMVGALLRLQMLAFRRWRRWLHSQVMCGKGARRNGQPCALREMAKAAWTAMVLQHAIRSLAYAASLGRVDQIHHSLTTDIRRSFAGRRAMRALVSVAGLHAAHREAITTLRASSSRRILAHLRRAAVTLAARRHVEAVRMHRSEAHNRRRALRRGFRRLLSFVGGPSNLRPLAPSPSLESVSPILPLDVSFASEREPPAQSLKPLFARNPRSSTATPWTVAGACSGRLSAPTETSTSVPLPPSCWGSPLMSETQWQVSHPPEGATLPPSLQTAAETSAGSARRSSAATSPAVPAQLLPSSDAIAMRLQVRQLHDAIRYHHSTALLHRLRVDLMATEQERLRTMLEVRASSDSSHSAHLLSLRDAEDRARTDALRGDLTKLEGMLELRSDEVGFVGSSMHVHHSFDRRKFVHDEASRATFYANSHNDFVPSGITCQTPKSRVRPCSSSFMNGLHAERKGGRTPGVRIPSARDRS